MAFNITREPINEAQIVKKNKFDSKELSKKKYLLHIDIDIKIKSTVTINIFLKICSKNIFFLCIDGPKLILKKVENEEPIAKPEKYIPAITFPQKIKINILQITLVNCTKKEEKNE